MALRTFARIYGVVFLVIGAAGFVPGVTDMDHSHPDVTFDAGLGLELGMFPVNILHNVVHLAFGVWGLLAARGVGPARGYARATAIIYALLMVMGLIEAGRLWTTFGLVPLYGNDVWLHALLAAGAAYFGFIHRERDPYP